MSESNLGGDITGGSGGAVLPDLPPCYRLQLRPTPQPDGAWLIIIPHAPMVRYKCSALSHLQGRGKGVAVLVVDARGNPLAEAFTQTAQQLGLTAVSITTAEADLYEPAQVRRLQQAYASNGFTDILIYGNPSAAVLEAAIESLAPNGALSFTCHHWLDLVAVNVGRLCQDRLLVMGTTSWDITDAYRHTRATTIQAGDRLLILGAGTALGQALLRHALTAPELPAQVVAVDADATALEGLQAWATPLAQTAGVELHLYCSAGAGSEAQQAHLRSISPYGFDQVVLLFASAEMVAFGYELLTDGGVLNIAAGFPRGTKVPLDLTLFASRHMRIIGSCGVSAAD